MANQDSFVTEVSDEVRRDKLFRLMRRYGWIAILAVVALVAGAAFLEWRKSREAAEAQAFGDAILEAISVEDAAARASALAALPAREEPTRRAIQGLLTASAQAEAGDAEAARATLEALAVDTEAPQIYRDTALLKSVMVSAGSVAPETRVQNLQPLFAPGNPLRLLALEQRAFAEVESGETEAAIATLRGILADAEVTEDLRVRATQLIVALGGTPEAQG